MIGHADFDFKVNVDSMTDVRGKLFDANSSTIRGYNWLPCPRDIDLQYPVRTSGNGPVGRCVRQLGLVWALTRHRDAICEPL
jgi:hypothetical protein